MLFPTLKLFLDRLADEVRPALAFLKNGVNTIQRPFGESGRGLLVVDLLSAHWHIIDDITNYYKPSFTRYHLFTFPKLMISSIHQTGRRT
jgi:hypothetical protein